MGNFWMSVGMDLGTVCNGKSVGLERDLGSYGKLTS